MRKPLFILSLGLFACGQHQTASWQTLDFGSFKLETPQGWTIIKKQGIDSYIGALTNRRDTLYFDFGWYSPTVGDEDPTKHKLAIDTVNGLLANIVIPITDGHGEIGMSIKQFKDGQNGFIISGTNIVGTDTILQIFKSIRFAESDTTKNPPLTLDKFKANPTGSGMKLFMNNCAGCHSRNRKIVGPVLQGMKTKHSFEWTYNFLTNRELLKNDTAFINLTKAKEYHCQIFNSLTKEELQLIIDYIN